MITVITAGGRVETADFQAQAGVAWKALLPCGPARLLDAGISAAHALGSHSIVLVAPPEVAAYAAERVTQILPASDDGRASLATALRCGEDAQPLLLLTCDLPFIDGAALGEFCTAARETGADAVMPLAEAADYRAMYPLAPAHCTRVGADMIANGSVFYFRDGRTAQRALQIAQHLFAARKSLWAMARLLSPGLLLRFAVGSLQIAQIESYAGKRFGIQARALRNMSPRLCFDVDDLADYQYFLQYNDSAQNTGR